MRISKYILVFCLLPLSAAVFSPAYAQIGMRELGDSLMAYTGFSRLWSPAVRVKQLRVDGNQVSVKTNATLKDYRWTPDNIADIKRKVSLWTLGHEKGHVTIFSGTTEISSLITDCAKVPTNTGKCKFSPDRYCDLTDKTVVLYPSHGLYYNRTREEWIWQRATLWTTVEDLYSQEYVRVIKRMLENAGATVLMPRADLDQHALGVSGMPQWAEGARYWLLNQGADSTIWNLYDGDEYKEDMKCRAMWINSLDTQVDLCVAFHTDGQDSGNDSTIIGTLVIYTAHDDDGNVVLRDGRDRERTNRNLADWIQTQVTEDLRHIAPEWTRRQLKEANYCESRVPVVPSIILELLSHKNMADMRYGLNPAFRFAASRAIYKGILRYLNGRDATVQPLPIRQLAINPSGLLRWEPVIDSLENSAVPSYYMVYIQENDGEWDVQQVDQPELQLTLKPGVRYNYYVVAGNDGGLSMPSPMISAFISEQENAPMALIVDGFDEVYGPEWFADSAYAGIVPGSYACEDGFSCAYIGAQWDYRRASEWKNDDNCGWGACYRDHAGQITMGNTHNWSVQHGRVLRKMEISYVSCTSGMLTNDQSPITNYQLIDYICGRNKQPLSAQTRRMLESHMGQGSKVLLSTDHFSAIEPAWAKKWLHTSFYADRATHSGRLITLRHRTFLLRMEPNEEQLFTCTPEALKPENGAMKILTYEDMRCTAAVGYKSPMTNDQSPITNTLVFGFPIEAVQDFEKIYRHSIEWLLAE